MISKLQMHYQLPSKFLFAGAVLTLLILFPFDLVSADHEGLNGLTSGGSGCGNYVPPPYYQGSYYSQTTYYSQPTYYLQGGYWPSINDITLTVTPKVVRIGEQATIVWNGGNASACTVTGAGINSTAISGSQIVTVTGEAVIEAQCNLGPNISRASTTIRVLPRIQESFNDSFDHFKNKLTSVF